MQKRFSSLSLKHTGSMLLEVMLSSSLFLLLVVAFWGVLFYGQESSRLSVERSRAVLLAQEGIEAVRNIRDEEFANLIDGTHGLALNNNTWTLFGTSDQTDIFTRNITVEPVDQYRKNITATVSWTQNLQRSGNVTLRTRLTDWHRFVAPPSSLIVDTTNAVLANGNRQLDGITLENTDTVDLTIATITVIWNNAELIEEIKIDGTSVWRFNNIGTPNGRQPTGTVLDIEDFTIPTGSGILPIDNFKFNGNMSGSTFTIIFTLTDNSTAEVTITP